MIRSKVIIPVQTGIALVASNNAKAAQNMFVPIPGLAKMFSEGDINSLAIIIQN